MVKKGLIIKGKNHIGSEFGMSEERVEQIKKEGGDLISKCNTAAEFIKAVDENDDWSVVEKVWIAFKLGESIGILSERMKK